ncbi:MAG: hypothetical protein JW990_06905 [Thermoleophilia bacterium]|nr:hypothetical protein [Thermoleophilia bacterium]
MAEERDSWVGPLIWGFIVGALIVLAVRLLLLLVRALWDYRREVGPLLLLMALPPFIGRTVSLSPVLRGLGVAVVVAAAALLGTRLWSAPSLAAGRAERFLSRIRRAWPRVASRSVGGRPRDWTAGRVSPAGQGVALQTALSVGFSAWDVTNRADAIAAAYGCSWCGVTRDPQRADRATVALMWATAPAALQSAAQFQRQAQP